MLSPSAHIQGVSSIFFVITQTPSHSFSVFISSPSELSAYPLMTQVIFYPRTMNYEFIYFLSCNKTCNFLLKNDTLWAWRVSALTRCLPQMSSLTGDYNVRSTHPISFICSVSFSGRHISSPHQLRNSREAAGEEEEGVLGTLIKSKPSSTAHEAVSSSLDPLLTPHMMEWMVLGEVCELVCVCVCSFGGGWVKVIRWAYTNVTSL